MTHALHLKALIFDVDGTLADTEEFHRCAFNAAFADFGLDWEWSPRLYAELLSTSGGQERIRRYAAGLPGHNPFQCDVVGLVRQLHAAKSAHYQRMVVENQVPLRPGVRRLLEEARSQAVRLAIATSSALRNVRTLLDDRLPGGWDSWFEVIATSDTVIDKKPSPAVYNHALSLMGLSPRECVAVEDTASGNRAAVAAGLTTIITTHAFTHDHDFRGASLVVNHLGEPHQPFEVIFGSSDGASYVDIALTRGLQRRTRPGSKPKRTLRRVAVPA